MTNSYAGRILMLVLLLGTTSACTTTSDLEHIDRSLNRKFDTLSSSLKDELRDIKSIQLAQDKRQDDLSKSVDALRTVIFANVDSMGRTYDNLDRSTKRLAESLKNDIELQQHILKDHQNFEGSVGSLQATVDGMAPLAASLEQQVQRLTDILRESYKTELLGLRERLKVLEGLAGPTPSTTQLRSENTSPAAGHSEKKPQTKRD